MSPEGEDEIIKNVNLSGENNDIIDKFEDLKDEKGIRSPELDIKIQEWRKEKNNTINFTKNELAQLSAIIERIQNTEKRDEDWKIENIIQAFDYTINYEIRETAEVIKNSPEKTVAKLNEAFGEHNNIAEISEYYPGKSDYIIILVPQTHGDYKGEMKKRSLNIQSQIKNISSILLDNNISNVFSMENTPSGQIATELRNNVFNELFSQFDDLQKDKPNLTTEQYKKKSAELIYNFNLVYQKLKNGEKMNLFGAEQPEQHIRANIAAGILISWQMIMEKTGANTNSNQKISQTFMGSFQKSLKESIANAVNKDTDLEIDQAKKDDIILEIIDKLFTRKFETNIPTIREYSDYLEQVFSEWTFGERNPILVENLKTIQKDTLSKAITFAVGGVHIFGSEKLSVINQHKTIPQILKEQGVSYVILKPKSYIEK